MQTKKLSFIKRIFVFFCCTVLISSSVFASYSMTVYASDDDYNLRDGLADICAIILGVAGIICPPAELTALGFVAITAGVLGAVDGAINIYDYVTDNGDGTYTISPEFVQAVMDAAQRLEDQGFNNYSSIKNSLGRYEYRGASTFIENQPARDSFSVTYSLESDKRLVCVNGTAWHINSDGSLSNSYDFDYKMYRNGQYYGSGRRSVWYWFNDSSVLDFTLGMNMPMYNTMDEAKAAVSSGDYSDALNYRERPIFRRHSSYTPTYSGGAVTVNRTVIENINKKITEVDADDSLTDDQKIEKLQEYIRTGGTGDTGGGGGTGGGSGDTDYDDNKDVPSGDDLTDTNSWLKKIYLKLCQISDDFKSFFIFKDAPGINAKYIASLLESIYAQLRSLWDEIHEQLTGISGDLSDIKKQLSNMSEQEFDEKSDSFLGEIMDAFSEISEVVKTKFPFSIPNDLRIFLSKIAPAAPETEEQQMESYSLDSSSGMTLYSGEHGGGGTSDGETNPPGGGGASRPGSGFVDVDHGGGGGSRDPVEMREAPVFRLPIVIERYGIEEYIIIDMAPFDPLSRFSRSFFTIIFMVCLFNLTFKVIGMWGDIVD